MSAWKCQRPLRFTHGETGLPPPHAPAVQVSPCVQGSPSSQAALSGDGEHADGSPVQVKHGSIWQLASQPSPLVVLPSRHWHRRPDDDPKSADEVAVTPMNRVSPGNTWPSSANDELPTMNDAPTIEPVSTAFPASGPKVKVREDPDWTTSTR